MRSFSAVAADPIGWLRALGLEATASWLDHHPFLAASLGLVLLLALALGAFVVTRTIVLRVVGSLAKRSPMGWDDLLIQERVLHRAAWALPALLIHQLVEAVPHLPDAGIGFLQRIALAWLVLVVLRTMGALLSVVNVIYARYPMARNRPIKGYLQVVLIVAWIFGVVLIAAILMDRSPWMLLSGLGAMTAILLLVFRDTLLSLVAGVQLTTNDLIRIGDWIDMPQFGADGDVVDIGLHAVKVQNWDRTITVIPTHRFLEHSFRNWRGMQEAGGRRIKRAFHLDMTSIRFLDEAEIEHYSRFTLLADYMAQKRAELAEYNRDHEAPGLISNARHLTNVGTLRAWILAYLRQHPNVRQDMTFLVRQLAPTPDGLPIEIYVFCNDIRWTVYETVQADIFDHVLAMVPQFGLRVFQSPAGHDFASLGRGVEAAGRVQQQAAVSEVPLRNELIQKR